MVEIKIHKKNDFVIYELLEPLRINSDLQILKKIIKEAINNRIFNIAISFKPDSAPNSDALAVLIYCCDKVRRNCGRFVFINPGGDIIETFKIYDLLKDVEVVDSEDQLGLPDDA